MKKTLKGRIAEELVKHLDINELGGNYIQAICTDTDFSCWLLYQHNKGQKTVSITKTGTRKINDRKEHSRIFLLLRVEIPVFSHLNEP